MAHGVAHQRPAFEHQKHRQQRAGNGDDDRYRYRIDHKRKLERGQEQVQHAASLARRRLASRPCFGAKIKVMRNSSVCAVEIVAEPGAEETGQAADSHGDSQQAREAIG